LIDPSQLYRLAIATGTTLDLEKCCERYLQALMDVKDLSIAAVWLHHSHLVGHDTAFGEAAEPLLVRFHQRPADRKGTLKIQASHPLMDRLAERDPLPLRLADPLLRGVLEDGDEGRGHVAVFGLGRIGFLVGCSTTRRIGFSQSEFNELKDPMAVFTSSVEGCLAYQEVSRESARQARLEAAVRRSEEHWRALIANGLDVILLLDYDGTIRFASPSTGRALGYPDENFKRATFLSFAHPDDVPQLMERLRGELMKPGIGPTFDLRLRHSSGEWRIFEVRTNSLLSVPSVAGIILNCRDVTEAKMQEKALEEARLAALSASRARGEFLANMSHEIRTPMNGVLGMTSLLLDTPLSSEQTEYVQTAASSGRALLAIVDQVLDFSKIESGAVELDLAPVDLRQIVEEVIDTAAANAATRGIDLCYRISRRLPPLIISDMVKVRQILLNLVSNAVKYTDHGEVTVDVSVRDHPGGDDELLECCLSVSDTGVGIPPAKLEQLFEPFRQSDPSDTRLRGGTGLGLAISKNLAEALGGRIQVTSVEGEGSTFSVPLPVAAAGRSSAEDTDSVLRSLDGTAVLVAHPRPTARAIQAELVSRWGGEPSEASSPEEALAILRSRQPVDAVILGFGQEDQRNILRNVRRRRRRRSLAVVALYPFGEAADPDLVADDRVRLIHSPYRHGRLHRALVAALDGREAVVADARPSRQSDEVDLGSLSVLLADDNAMNRRISQLMLSRMGVEADMVENGREVLDALAKNPYDVVLMDIRMPVMDGIEATRQIRTNEDGPQPTIIALTAHAMPGDRERFLRLGMDAVVNKPVQLEDLTAALQQLQLDSTEAPAVEPQVLDVEVIQGLRALRRPGFVMAVVDGFFDGAQEDFHRLEAALRRDDAAAMADVAHHLLGSCLTVGANRLADVARDLERVARSGDSGQIPRLMDSLGLEYELVRSILIEQREDR
jgi:PAS domain S-box-containing protein